MNQVWQLLFSSGFSPPDDAVESLRSLSLVAGLSERVESTTIICLLCEPATFGRGAMLKSFSNQEVYVPTHPWQHSNTTIDVRWSGFGLTGLPVD